MLYLKKHALFIESIKKGMIIIIIPLSGAEGNRTPVQTYSPKAFYMLISLLIVGDEPETNKPIHHLAVWS